MRCPSCDTAIKDEAAAFCPRCGVPLASAEGEATTELKAGDTEVLGVNDTAAVERPAEAAPPDEAAPPVGAAPPDEAAPPVEAEADMPETTTGTDAPAATGAPPEEDEVAASQVAPAPAARERPGRIVRDLLVASRRAARTQGLAEIALAATMGFLALVACGAVLVVAAKLQYPFLGEGAGPFRILSAIVMTGLGVLRVPIHIGDLSLSALPLGALLAVGWMLTWATARIVARGPATSMRDRVLDGMKVAIPFALLCWISALVFRISEPPVVVAADAGAALLLSLLWGAIFGAIGGVRAFGPLRGLFKMGMHMLSERKRVLYEGLSTAGIILAVTVGAAAFASLVWIIVGLLSGRPSGGLGAGEAVAAVIYLIAFGPNVIVSIVSVALGAPVEVGAQVTASGRLVGPLKEISLFDWGGGGAPWYAFLLLLIPLGACLIAGFSARRSTRDAGGVVHVLVIAAAVFALVMFELAGLSEARLGAGLVRSRGFGRVAPDAGAVLLLSFAWVLVAGFVGWKIGDAGDPALSSEATRDGSAR